MIIFKLLLTASIPVKISTVILTGFLAFFSPILYVLYGTCFIVLLDTYLGVKVSRLYREKVESHKMWKTIKKMVDTMLFIIAAHVVNIAVVPLFDIKLVPITAGLVCFTELISIAESYCELHKNSRLAQALTTILKAKGEKYLGIPRNEINLEIDVRKNKGKKKKDESVK